VPRYPSPAGKPRFPAQSDEGGNPFAGGFLQLVQDGDTLLQVDRDGPGGTHTFETVVRLVGVVEDQLSRAFQACGQPTAWRFPIWFPV